jgi:predicted ATPase/DNA-binding CsgD family transcriptional regulator/transcriptional regulator with XRE-family HTH domain
VPEQPALSFGGLLRRLRDDAGLTQEELAEAASLSPRSISDLERGVNLTARHETARLLAGALGLSGPQRALFEAAARGRVPASQVLADGEGAAATAATRTLPRDIASSTGRVAELAQGCSAAATVAGGVHGFPVTLTSFVGRDGPVREVAGLLADYRLVTVTGPGGSGKTRLAGEVARRVAGRFADGAWLVELAPVIDPEQVPAVVAAALGVRDMPGGRVAEAVARVLARQQLLLVLDNCEHVIGAAAELCAGLLLACDDVRLLTTSREPLAVSGEARYRLPPLALPGLDADDRVDVGRWEAVALFADRARQADMHFALTGETGPMVACVVRRLDGMPLAIELAAARVESLGVAQLLDRLDDRFEVLADGDRLAPDRQRSLAATVEWSYQLLDEPERRVFRWISAFPGPFTLEGAEAVAGQGAGPAVLRLVDCSLLSPPRTGPDGRSRYLMLETLRAYGSALLARSGEQDAAAVALAGYALHVAGEAAAGLQTVAGELDAAHWLDAEDATMRQVLAWARQHDPAAGLRLAVALGWWWFLRGRLQSQYLLLRELARRAEVGSDGWCAAQFWLGWACVFSADPAGALDEFTVLCEAVADRGPSRALADGLAGRSTVWRRTARYAEAASDGRRSLAIARQIGYPVGEVVARSAVGYAALFVGDHAEAVQVTRQAEQVRGDIPGSIARHCGVMLTDALIEAGGLAEAEQVCAAALARSRDAGDLWNLPMLLLQMTILDLRAGRIRDATAHLREGLEVSLRTGSRSDLLDGLDCCGYLCAATGRHAEAVTMWAANLALGRREGYTEALPFAQRRDEPMRQARQALGEGQAGAAEGRGAAMSPATATEYALLLTDPTTRRQPPAPAGLGKLSARERELVTLVAQGRNDAQIAAQLCISVRTVHSHLDRIRDKTGFRRRADLTRLALQADLV